MSTTLVALSINSLIALPAAASENQKAAALLEHCYFVAASAYGANKCDPPPTLSPAVHGRCSSEEDSLMAALSEAAKAKPGDPDEVARVAMAYIQRKLEPQVQSWILDAQIKAGGCAKPGSN